MAHATIQDIVLDSGALIHMDAVRLAQLAERIWTVQAVLEEVRDERARLALAGLPFEIKTRQPSSDSLKAVTDFAKKTGDYASLSRTDLLVLALVHTLEVEKNPSAAARPAAPPPPAAAAAAADAAAGATAPKTWGAVLGGGKEPSSWRAVLEGDTDAGNVFGGEDEPQHLELTGGDLWPTLPVPAPKRGLDPLSSLLKPSSVSAASLQAAHQQHSAPAEPAASNLGAELAPPRASRILLGAAGAAPAVTQHEEEASEEEGEWASPGTALDARSGWGAERVLQAALKSTVACATGDFAMQNVLLQMRLRVVTIEGRMVTKLTHWVLKCDACFTVIPADTTRKFCPACGNATLARLAYSIDAKGVRHYHYSKNRRVNTRGSRFSVPRDSNMLLREDQMLTGIWAQRLSRKADASSMFGQDVNDAMGLALREAAPVTVGFGSVNPNAAKGRERRGKAKSANKFAAAKGGQRAQFLG